jgi:tetratricopeptide (TPR) repeat protein/tRNA A-37 threonylcarbamoyl transferase component Bud32
MELFEQALEQAPAQRAEFLDQRCGGITSLRHEIDALLAADAASDGFLARPLNARDDRSGERLGAYRLIQLIGSGGMGSVYRAERADKAYAKPVAIKLLLIDAKDLRTRFALEQRILGGITHPNIASLLDIGTGDHGAPYLVMEYVEGQPITDYARGAALDLGARADVFLKILDAVQTAHSQLIVHRDLKPGNVLVDAHGEPKLLDFGIAKLLGDDSPSATRTGLGPLTPNYASPEQVRGEPIGTGSDIYSLGVLLFELMTGELPYRIEDTRPSAIERIVCDTDPPRPSAHLLSYARRGNPRDLDAIILKALQKSPRQRYTSCAAFAEDLRRWRNGEQVQAREAPFSERALRYLRRHRLVVSVASAASLALLIGSAAALWQAHAASLARGRAERVNRFLTDMLSAANPGDLGRNATVAAVLDRAHRLADRELVSDPQEAATTQMTLVKTYAALGDWNAARGCAEAALKAARQVGDTATTIDAEIGLGEILVYTGNADDAKAMLDRGREDARRSGTAAQKATAAHILGRVENRKNNLQAARQWYETALAEVPTDDPDSHSYILNDLASIKQKQGDAEGGLALQRESVQLMRATYPQGNPALAVALSELGSGYAKANQLQAASRTYAEALSMEIDLLGGNHPNVIVTLSDISTLELKEKDIQSALSDGLRASTAAQRLPASAGAYASHAYMAYGNALIEARRPQEAIPLLERTLAIYQKMLPADHPYIANAESALGLARAENGDVAGGATLARSAYERLRAKLGETNELAIVTHGRLTRIETMADKPSPIER